MTFLFFFLLKILGVLTRDRKQNDKRSRNTSIFQKAKPKHTGGVCCRFVISRVKNSFPQFSCKTRDTFKKVEYEIEIIFFLKCSKIIGKVG